MQRERDRMERQGDDFRARLRGGYLIEAAAQPDKIVVVDAAHTIEAVQSAIQAAVERAMARRPRATQG
jgi:dTMP kinase